MAVLNKMSKYAGLANCTLKIHLYWIFLLLATDIQSSNKNQINIKSKQFLLQSKHLLLAVCPLMFLFDNCSDFKSLSVTVSATKQLLFRQGC